ncbi:hypothetical protein C7974DRAFT_444811 [Boeremia exigua]|uniref:uncharacterized protein n=1 Tax=Boeremia exigua TaxID=749465 RepID=UPI001E8EE5B1|nr:uncharacterized protein C7974DRAFT_444811 [Boeremia exigua]KAH6613163.1 hypothetical protein C7974DRAFT_444811 [Boeremia exigua]
MSSFQPTNTPSPSWVAALEGAAAAFHGGPRSFPPSCDRDMAANYAYEPPNRDYERLFSREARVHQCHSRDSALPRSAGWLVPSQESVCRPVLVAHSMLAAIWLIRETLPDDALPAGAWQQLAAAAQACADDALPPPSAQRSPTSLSLLHDKRSATHNASLSPAHAKRLPNGPAAITTITNNNRRAERARAQRREKAQARLRLEAGLAAPTPDAPRREQGAYQSIELSDEAHVSWLFKQPVDGDVDLFSSAATPYTLAATMIKNARSIGNASSQSSAAAFLRGWRAQGTPFAQDLTDTHPTSSSIRASTSSTSNALAAAWTLCERYEQELDVIHIKYRWAMAFLGKTYTDKMEEIRSKERVGPTEGARRGRAGKGKVSSEAINELLSSVPAAPDPRHRQRFKRRLHQALRWYEAASRLGWGMLCLLPHDTISNSWVENDLRIPYWHIWLELVGRVNPAAYEASRQLQTWLGSEALSGGPISEKETLYIEATSSRLPLATSTQITEVADSDVGSDDESDSAAVPTQRQPMRQRTLLELFKPQLQGYTIEP